MTTLRRLQPYVDALPQWERVNDLYEGKHSVVCSDRYLVPHQIERTKDPIALELWAARKQRTKYLKLPRMIAEVLTAFFYRKMATLNAEGKALLGDAEADIDGKGNSLGMFIKAATKDMFRYGKLFVLVDAYGHEVQTRAQERAMGLRPFFSLVSPLAIPQWDIESEFPSRIGQLNMLRHEYSLTMPCRRAFDKIVTRYMSDELFIDDAGFYSIQRYVREKDQSGKLKTDTGLDSPSWKEDGGPILTQLMEIPIARVEGEPWLDEVCDEAERVLNLRSERDNVLHFQGYKQIWEIGADERPGDAPSGEYIYRHLPIGGGIAEVSEVNTGSWDNAINEGINYAYKMGLLQLRSLPTDSKVGQAADSMSEEKDTTCARVETAIMDLETCFNQALQFYAEFSGKKAPNARIEFNKEIAQESFDEVIQIWQAFSDIFKRVEVVTAEVAKKAAKRIGLSPEGLQNAYDAIDKIAGEIVSEGDEARARLANQLDPMEKALGNGRPDTEAENQGE